MKIIQWKCYTYHRSLCSRPFPKNINKENNLIYLKNLQIGYLGSNNIVNKSETSDESGNHIDWQLVKSKCQNDEMVL